LKEREGGVREREQERDSMKKVLCISGKLEREGYRERERERERVSERERERERESESEE
jgi:hypothetical protein